MIENVKGKIMMFDFKLSLSVTNRSNINLTNIIRSHIESELRENILQQFCNISFLRFSHHKPCIFHKRKIIKKSVFNDKPEISVTPFYLESNQTVSIFK